MTREEKAQEFARNCAEYNNLPIEVEHLLHTAFIAGYNEREDEEKNPWHKASEELPKESGSYFVKYTIDSCSVPYDGICRYYECRWINAHRLGNGRIHITHWMPIPELPKED